MRKMVFFVYTFTVLFFTSSLFSQALARRGSIGASFYNNIPDSIKQRIQYVSGAIVMNIFPNTTASSLEIIPMDNIIKVNNTNISNSKDIVAFAKNIRSGQPILFSIIRNGKLIEKKVLLSKK